MLEKFDAVLFDFDGTLADTMEDNFSAWQKAFINFKVKISREDYFPLEGMKLADIAEKISKKYNLIGNCQEIVQLKNKYYLENHSVLIYSEMLVLIEMLKNKRIKIAIVSASPRQKLEKTVEKKFLEKFDAVISGDDYNNGKPHSEPYLTALKKLNLNPQNCIAIENSPLGVKSAKSAGLYCIAVTTTLDKEYLKEADEIINMDKINNLFLN